MTPYEIVVIVGGMILGYYIVTILLHKKSDNVNNNHTDSTQYSQHDTSSETVDNDTSLEKEYISTHWYGILDIAENADQEQIRSAYQLKISQYHPDKVAHMGTEIRELANLRTKQINAAYNFAMKFKP